MLAFRRGKDDLGSLFVVNLHGTDAREVVATKTNPETPVGRRMALIVFEAYPGDVLTCCRSADIMVRARQT